MRNRVDDNMYNIGSNIRAARKRANLTQEELSESIGVTSQHLSELERGLVGTSISTLMKICSKLNVSADFILFGRGYENGNGNLTLIEKIQKLPKYQADMVEENLDLFLKALNTDPGQQYFK